MNFDTRRCNFDTKCNISIRKDALRYNFNIRCQYKKIHYDTCCNQSNNTLEACQRSIRFGHLSKCNLIPLWRYQNFFYKLQFLEFHFKAFPIWLFYCLWMFQHFYLCFQRQFFINTINFFRNKESREEEKLLSLDTTFIIIQFSIKSLMIRFNSMYDINLSMSG